MSAYPIAREIDRRCYPNDSFEVGDVDGDGRPEIVFPRQDRRAMVVKKEGR